MAMMMLRSHRSMTSRCRVIGSATKGFCWASRGALAAALLGSALGAAAADLPPSAANADIPPLSTELVKPGLYRISGAGGATLLRLSPEGPIVVDAKRAGTYAALMAEIQRLAKRPDQPVRALILTGAGPEQAGNLARFVDAGVTVIVQRRALARLVGDASASGTAAPKPFITYDADYVLRVGEVEVEHVGRGRTGADSIVSFPDLRVIAVGDLFTAATPEPDCASGGSFAGWAAAIDHLLWSDFDIAVPSRGAPVGKPELMALKATLEALARRSAASAPGQTDCRPSR
jgi:glyoxylase-like metal-dependent hydrolase (beta-lactamase superfamily II)